MTTIGVLKEVKDNENRVGLTPDAIYSLCRQGHFVYVEPGAGEGADFSDEEYQKAGAIVPPPLGANDILHKSDIIVKVKEPTPGEFERLKALFGKTLFTFLHLSANPELADFLNDSHITGISYDTIEDAHGRLPLLTPMSEIAGKFAAEFALEHREPGQIKKAVIMGGGTVGLAAAKSLIKNAAKRVTIYEKNFKRAEELQEMFRRPGGTHVEVFGMSKQYGLKDNLDQADLLIGAVLVKGALAPKVVSEQQVSSMKKGALIVDVAIDQGGCIAGARATSHSEPTYEFLGKTYCCIPNMPGMRPREATEALVNVSLPYLRLLANFGSPQALDLKPGFYKGLNTYRGEVVNEQVRKDLGMQ